MNWSNASLLEDWPGKDQGMVRMRGGASDNVKRLLLWAAFASAIRLAALPFLMAMGDYKHAVPITHDPILVSSIGFFAFFLLCASFGRVFPILSTLVAIVCFSAWCFYDFQIHSDIFEAGIIGKSIIAVPLIFGFMQAVMSRTL